MNAINPQPSDPSSSPDPQKATTAKTEIIGSSTEPTTEMPDVKTIIGGLEQGDAADVSISLDQKIGKYELRGVLGKGGMGAVYLAFDPLIEREVAVKVLFTETSSAPAALQRFLGEARAIGKLNHPHVVSIYDIDQWNGQYFLVMELLSGGSVAERVQQTGKLSWQEACRLIVEAAEGLAAAHSVGMIHRDIKPENLMLTREGAVKVVDFGLSKLLDAAQDPETAVTKAGQVLGTPHYMSPEQFEAKELDARTDIYSLGASLFRLLTARFPFQESQTVIQMMAAHLTKAPPIASEYEADIPPAVDRIIQKSMAKLPEDRYQSALDLAQALNEVLSAAENGPSAVQDVDRPLKTATIIEPSKLQAAILKDACLQSGARIVRLLTTLQSAREDIQGEVPDLLVTSMQLPDGKGVDFLNELSQDARFQHSTLVLNSSDSTLEELASAGSAGCLVLAPKKVRPDEILRVVHAVGPVVVGTGNLTKPIDPTTVRLQIVLDGGRIPDALAELIRELNLLDVSVNVDANGAPSMASPADLVLVLRQVLIPSQSVGFASLIKSASQATGPTTIAVQVDQDKLWLRAVCRHGVVAICRRELDQARLVCLLQACRS